MSDSRILNLMFSISLIAVLITVIMVNIPLMSYDVQAQTNETFDCTKVGKIDSSRCSLPVADPGPNLEVDEGASVTLDGSKSYDPDGTIESYSWSVEDSDDTCPPAGYLKSSNEVKVEFVANEVPKDCRIYYDLTVTDNDGYTNSKGISVTVKDVSTTPPNENQAPVADAGNDQNVVSKETVRLDGSKSKDPDCDRPNNPNCGKLKYSWERFDDGPAIRGLTGLSKAKPKFIAPVVDSTTVLRFRLVVNDGVDDSAPSTVNIAVDPIGKPPNPPGNSPPIADAGSDQENVKPGQTVYLDGTGSHDPDSDDKILSYSWLQSGGPHITLIGDDTSTPYFVPLTAVDEGPSYEFQLVVTDSNGKTSDPSAVSVVLESGTPDGGIDILRIITSNPLLLVVPVVATVGFIAVKKFMNRENDNEPQKNVTVDVYVSGGLKH